MNPILTWLHRYYAGEYLEDGMLYEDLQFMVFKKKWKIVKRFINDHYDDNGYGLTLIGKMYFNGDGGYPVNRKLAYSHFIRASKLGNLDAINFIAFMKWQFQKCPEDLREAERQFKYILNRGNSNGANNLGRMFITNRRDEAMEYFKIAVDMGNRFGSRNLAANLPETDWIKYIRRNEEIILNLNRQLKKIGHRMDVSNLVGISNHTIRSSYNREDFLRYIKKYMAIKIEMEKIIKNHDIEALQTFLIRDQRQTAVNMLTDPYLCKYIGFLVAGKYCEIF